MKSGRRTLQLVLCSGALVLAAAGVGYATIPDSGNVIRGCVLRNVGTVRLIDASPAWRNLTTHCAPYETPISWNQQGVPGPTGPQGPAAPTPDYGVVNVNVSRGAKPATIWAQYATPLGSPVGSNTAGGTFRFTCSSANAPCTISVSAAVLGSANHTLYPRLLVYRSGDGNGTGAPAQTCEYADGSTGSLPLTIAHQASSTSPSYSPVPVNIGLTADCGNVPNVPAGDVPTIIVPNGYYDVTSTFSFGS